jgi:hypothetical protein
MIASFGSASTWRSTGDILRMNSGSRFSLADWVPVDDLLAAARKRESKLSSRESESIVMMGQSIERDR